MERLGRGGGTAGAPGWWKTSATGSTYSETSTRTLSAVHKYLTFLKRNATSPYGFAAATDAYVPVLPPALYDSLGRVRCCHPRFGESIGQVGSETTPFRTEGTTRTPTQKHCEARRERLPAPNRTLVRFRRPLAARRDRTRRAGAAAAARSRRGLRPRSPECHGRGDRTPSRPRPRRAEPRATGSAGWRGRRLVTAC